MLRKILPAVLLWLLCTCACAQSLTPALTDFNENRLQHEQRAMLVLGGWAVANIGAGLALRATTTGETRRFHEMNALWNTVNLGLAGLGYLAATRADPAAFDLLASLREQGSFQKILLFNAGLDVGYLVGGLYLRERARRPGASADRLRGYGNSILLQGGFLLVFDLVNYFIASGRDGELELLIGATGNGLGLGWTF